MPRTSPPPSSAQKVHGMALTAPPQSVQPSTSTATKLKTTASTSAVPSTSESQNVKSTLLKTSQHLLSPDIEVDVSGMTPDPENHMEDITTGSAAGEEISGDSEVIVRQLEKSLPRWQGFGELGWMSEVSKASIHESTAHNLCGCFLSSCLCLHIRYVIGTTGRNCTGDRKS